MPASITLTHLGWSRPDGEPVLSNLDLSFGPERTGLVGRNGVGKSTLLQLIAGTLTPMTGRVTVAGTLGVLRQSLQPAAGETVADLFGTTGALDLLARAERGLATTDELAIADWTIEPRMAEALTALGLSVAAETRLDTLSGGQRTRVALAALLYAAPDFLLLDEPTNTLDREGRAAVADVLNRWRGGAIVVSHDRELLDRMDAIVELTSLGATRYGGTYSAYRSRKAVELEAAAHRLGDAERQVADLARKAQLASERQARRDGAGQRKAAKGDMPRILIGNRKGNAEATSGTLSRLADRRRSAAIEDAETARARIEVLTPFAVRLAPSGLAAGREVLRLNGISAGYYDAPPLFEQLEFGMVGPERVAIAGPNGAGKSTLLRVITGALTPLAGTARIHVPYALFDQEVSLIDRRLTVRENFRRLNPEADENACRAALARFMFRADAALAVAGTLSGGQLLRAGLAAVLGGTRPPQLLILDEPTNHLDLDSIAAVEAGLSAYDGALLVVSHDERFLEAIGITRRLVLPGDAISRRR